jgi:hypothetical protein
MKADDFPDLQSGKAVAFQCKEEIALSDRRWTQMDTDNKIQVQPWDSKHLRGDTVLPLTVAQPPQRICVHPRSSAVKL